MDSTPKDMKSVGPLAKRAETVLSQLCKRGLKLTTAESCTGGLVAALVTDIEGCSHAFERGYVTYTDAAKHELLGVDQDLLHQKGAVSQEVAIAMAEGALQRSDANVAVSVTGFAGPGGENDEEGLVHFALAREEAVTTHVKKSFGAVGRDQIRRKALETVLEIFERMLSS
ncbi:MAG: CinA family protein [Celeribacter sp.]|jgi:nicotinamide-nucleotide amidase